MEGDKSKIENGFLFGGYSAHGELYLNWKTGNTFNNKSKEQPTYLNLMKYKTDLDKSGKEVTNPMQGVSFTLEDVTPGAKNKSVTKKTSSDGLVQFKLEREHQYHLSEVKNTVNENYFIEGPWIVETDKDGNVSVWKAKVTDTTWEPDGDKLNTFPHEFNTGAVEGSQMVQQTLYCYDVVNNYRHDMYVLPESGGMGSMIFTLSGVALMALAGAGMAHKMRKRAKQ